MISAGTAFAVSDDVALQEVTDDVNADSVISVNLDDTNNIESNANVELISEDNEAANKATKISGFSNVSYSTEDVLNGTAVYPLILTRDGLIPIPLENKTVDIKFNGISESYITNAIGLIVYEIPYAPAGNYSLEMVFEGSEGYDGSSLTASVEIYDVATQILALGNSSYPAPLVREDLGYYPVALTTTSTVPTPLANRTLYIEVGGIGDFFTTNSLGIVNYFIPADLATGNYTVNVLYGGEEGYAKSTFTTSLEIYDVATQILALGNSSYPTPLVEEGLAYYPIALTWDNGSVPMANRTLYIDVGGIGDFFTTNSLGIVDYFIPVDLAPGNYDVNVLYGGEDGYAKSTFTTSLEIFDIPTVIYGPEYLVFSYDEVINSDAVFYAFLTTDIVPIPLANKTVIVEFNGVGGEFTTNSLGMIRYSLFNSPVGTYDVTIKFDGVDGYAPSIYAFTVDIERSEVEISADDVTVDYADPEGKVTATLTNEYGKPLSHAGVSVSLNGEDYTLKTNTKGQIELSTADLLPGNYVATISYKGNPKKYDAATTDVLVTVNKVDTIISAVYDNSTKQLIATLTDSDGKALKHANVVVTIRDMDYTVKTNSKGQAIFSTEDLDPSIYLAYISYQGSKIYKSTDTAIIFVTLTTFIAAPDVQVVYGDEEGKFVATLYDINGNGIKNSYLTVKLNGETYKLKTDASGNVEISTAGLLPGSYDVTVSYKGNDKGYTPFTAEAVVTVSKIDTNISTSYDVKSRTLTATLTDSDGKALKNAYLTVKIEGKSHKVKTDSKGQATLVIEDDLEKGLYTADISYKGGSKYSSANAKETIVIL